MSPTERAAGSAGADSGIEALIASWTADRPDPDHWIRAGGIERARTELEAALRAGARSIFVSGPSGHGKTTLIRSIWHDPPSGFAAIFVPPLDASEPDQIAERILAAARNGAVHDAAGALSRLLRAQSLRGKRPVLLVDDLQDMAPATLAELLALADASRVDFSVVAAGSPGGAFEQLRRTLPRPVRKMAVADPWTRADAERLIARISASMPIGAGDLLAAIDVPEALRASAGNPRLVRAALAAQLRQLNLPTVEPVIAPPQAAAPIEPANFEPVAPESPPLPPPSPSQPPPSPPVAAPSRAPAPIPAAATPPPVRATATPPPVRATASPPPVRATAQRAPRVARSRPRRRLSARASRRIAGGLVAAVAFVLLVDRAPVIAAWSAATARAYAADTADRIAEWRPKVFAAGRAVSEAGRSISDEISGAAQTLSAAARAWVEPRAPSPPVPPPIRVAVNSDPWSHVEVDGVAAGATPLMIELAPGPHRFRAEMADGRTVEREFDVAPDRNRVVLR